MRTVLIVAAHTDDEALGCGGTIAKHAAQGDKVFAVFMADGVTSRTESKPTDHASRHLAAENAKCVLGICRNIYLDWPDNRLDSVAMLDIVQGLQPILQELQPDIIYTHHHGDLNVDHQRTHEAVLTACRPTPGSTVRDIYAFEVMSSTEWANPSVAPFLPNHFVDISGFLATKRRALEAYQQELRKAPHSRSIDHLEHLARHRGHTVGLDAAEAFVAVRTLR
jgi:LmbE family N-acetylglucosaminyl deacetylase